MSRLRAAGGSVSSASASMRQALQMVCPPRAAGRSWNPDVGRRGAMPRGEARTVHLAFTALGRNRRRKTPRVSWTGRLVVTIGADARLGRRDRAASRRTNRCGWTHDLVSSTNADAIYIGSARSSSASQDLQPYLEALLSLPSASLEGHTPRTSRHADDDSLASGRLARLGTSSIRHAFATNRWTSLWTTGMEETMLGLEILHDLEAERGQASTLSETTATRTSASTRASTSACQTSLPGFRGRA